MDNNRKVLFSKQEHLLMFSKQEHLLMFSKQEHLLKRIEMLRLHLRIEMLRLHLRIEMPNVKNNWAETFLTLLSSIPDYGVFNVKNRLNVINTST